ncbi:acyl-CoA dehydrogenase family protein [Bradyrhizobium diazoefficiens]|uniref:acyl-CoA dehydrogenase family protein n=1 Tax=Bradyrhizobium diazoefficiens TaxID=1355477 RepID=UPI00289D46D1|nr:acyl-CoA dehydrogenase family protein [Bradyrhizobium diazoefficiens]
MISAPLIARRARRRVRSAHGDGGTSNDFGLMQAYATARLLRLADGPDEVHRNQIARFELKKYSNP